MYSFLLARFGLNDFYTIAVLFEYIGMRLRSVPINSSGNRLSTGVQEEPCKPGIPDLHGFFAFIATITYQLANRMESSQEVSVLKYRILELCRQIG